MNQKQIVRDLQDVKRRVSVLEGAQVDAVVGELPEVSGGESSSGSGIAGAIGGALVGVLTAPAFIDALAAAVGNAIKS